MGDTRYFLQFDYNIFCWDIKVTNIFLNDTQYFLFDKFRTIITKYDSDYNRVQEYAQKSNTWNINLNE